MDSLNFHRRHLSVTQKACIAVGYKKEMQETVRQGNPTGANQHAPRKGGNISTFPLEETEPPSLDVPELPEPAHSSKSQSTRKSKVRDQAAAKVGVSGKTVDEAEKIADTAPELFALFSLPTSALPKHSEDRATTRKSLLRSLA